MNTTEMKIIKALIICAFMYGIGFFVYTSSEPSSKDERRIITKY